MDDPTRRLLPLVTFLGLLATLTLAAPVLAHGGFGGPVETRVSFPLWLVWTAGALVVAASFAVVGGSAARDDRLVPLRSLPVSPARPAPALTLGRLVGLGVLTLVVLNALRPGSGSVLPQTVLWLLLWGVLPILAYTVGDLWPRVSPFEAMRPLADRLRGRRPPLHYPERLGAWPAAVLLLALIGLEVSHSPWAWEAAPLALLVAGYVVLTFLALVLFGAVWLDRGEVFTCSFRWWRAAAPFVWDGGRLRWCGLTGTLDRLPVRTSGDVAFTIGLLYGVNFDAFLKTALGRSASSHYAEFVPFSHVMLLLTGYLLFFAVWLVAAKRMRDAAGVLSRVGPVSLRFAATLMPIAVGYHLSHNLFTLIENVPLFLVAALDPFGSGRVEAFGVPMSVTLPAVTLGLVAPTQIGFILAGHVVAVVAAHESASRSFASRIQALRSEVPLAGVMVVYTWTGLALLSGAYGGGP